MTKIYIGVAWPYANGPIHVGHMAGCNLPPDIFRKFNIMRGNQVLMVSGSDMHGTPVTVRAEKEGMKPEALAEKYHQMNMKAFKDFGVEFDLYLSTEDRSHQDEVKKIFLRLHELGFLYEKEMELPYCPKCDRTLPDRYVEGECPNCHFEKARGDQCEECGKLMDPDMLIGLKCITCGTTPEFVKRTHFFFKLSAQEEYLKGWMATKDYWRPHVLNFSKMYLESGLKDRPVTRDTTYGIEIPLPGHDDKRIYVWFEAFMGYFTMSIEWARRQGRPDAWKEFWQDPECRHYYFLGKDNIPFHTIFWPAVLKSLDWNLNLPYDVPANALLKFGGQQFSKSRGVSIDIRDIVTRFDPDAVRYYMTVTMPENRDSDFSWEDFITRNNSELVATYGNFVHRALSFTHKNFGDIPAPKAPGPEEKEVEARISQANAEAAQFLEKCEFKSAIKTLMELARFGNQYIDTKAPWSQLKQDRDACGTTLYYSICISKALSVMMSPFMPFSSQKLWETLGEQGKVLDAKWEHALTPPVPGTKLAEPAPLFKKLEASEAEKEVKKMEPQAISGLEKLDLRVAEVKTASDHPNADKLLVLTVDVGGEVRQLCAGLKKHYTPEEFVGKKIIVVCNLMPAKLRGVMSEGMLLAATEGEVVSLLAPPQDAKPGDRVEGTTAATQMTIGDFATFQLQIGSDRGAEYVTPEGQHHPFKVNGKAVGTDRNVGPGSKIK